MSKASEAQLNQYNQQLRDNPEYQAYLRGIGVNTAVPAGQAWRLSDQQRKQAEAWVQRRTGDLGKRMEIDSSGNVNQTEGFGAQARRWGPIVAAGVGTALTAGGASPLLAAAVGGGIGGTTGALDEGGLKGGLIGGAIGAAPGVTRGLTTGWGTPANNLTAGLSRAVPANIASQGVSQGYSLPSMAYGATGAASGIGLPAGTFTGSPAMASGPGSTFNQLVGARSIPGGYSLPNTVTSQNLTGGGGMGFMDWVRRGKGLFDDARDVADTFGTGASQASQSMATNRGEKLSAQMDLERLMMDRDRDFLMRQILREGEGRESATDAIKKLMGTQRMLSPAQRPDVSPYAAPQRQATADERTGASALSAEVMKRLTGGNPIPEQVLRALDVDRSLMDPSIAENFLGYGGAAARAYGSRNRPIYVQSANDYATNYGRP